MQAEGGKVRIERRQNVAWLIAADLVVTRQVSTVGFDVGDTGTAADTLKQCATDPTKYYNADNSEELKQAYMDIALKLSSLYLSR